MNPTSTADDPSQRPAELEGFARQLRAWIEANAGQRRRLGEMRASGVPWPQLDDMIARAEQAGAELQEALHKLEAMIAGPRPGA